MRQKVVEQDIAILQKLFVAESSRIEVRDTNDSFETDEMEKYPLQSGERTSCLLVSGPLKLEEDYDTIIQVDSSKGKGLANKKEFRFIQRNGVIRWVYPKGNMKSVLCFYHASTVRSKIVKFGMKTLAALKLDGFISRKLTIHSNLDQFLQRSATDVPFSDFSIFMGTPGAERTVLVSLLNNGVSTAFLKLGINSISQFNVSTEGLVLFRLNRHELEHIEVPTVKSTFGHGAIAISKLSSANKKSVSHSIQYQHVNALLEMARLSRSNQHFSNSTFGEAITDNCAIIKRSDQSNTKLGKLLLESFDGVPYDLQFTAGLAHGDFTPWNMFTSKNKLYLYDWELSIRCAPSLFDLFHFHFLTGIYLKRWSFNEIYAQIKFTIEAHEALQSEIKTHQINVKRHLELYLQYVVARKMALQIASGEAEELLEKYSTVWCDAFLFVLPERASNRAGFMNELEELLSGVEHAFLKFNARSLAHLPESSDLDIAIEQSSLTSIIKFCKNHRFVKRSRSVKKSFMTTIELFFVDGRYLSIDLIYDFRRKCTQFMDIRELLYHSSKNSDGVSVPALEHDIEYSLLFYTLNGATVPEKYIEFFESAKQEDQLRTLRYFQHKYLLPHPSITSLLSSFELSKSAIDLYFMKKSSFSPLVFIKSRWNYLVDTCKEKLGRRGFMLTVSGVDGVGKSTVIELLKVQLEAKYRKDVVLLRHRPKLLPILSAFKYGGAKRAESRTTHLTPNEVSKKSLLGSYARFSYYYLDYLLGQFYVRARYVWGGKIVLYDRYYFDVINHPQRTNFLVNRTFAKWLYRPIIQPEMNIFLNASPEEIRKRKEELTHEQIAHLSGKYLSLFREFSEKYSSGRYVVHRNDNLSITVSEILLDIQQVA